MKRYYRLILGRRNQYAMECFAGNFIGVDYGVREDLTEHLPDDWREFNRQFIPIYLRSRPDKTKISAGLACGALWTVAKGLQIGDVVLCPDGAGLYQVGEVTAGYSYHLGANLPHRRGVRWLQRRIERSAMSEPLKNSVRSIGTVCDVSKFALEIEQLIGAATQPLVVSTDPEIENPSSFVMEKHLEDFLMENWKQTELGTHYDIFEEDGELVGQQYLTDTGPIDILAISRDKQELLVVELKKGRASDSVVGQIQRYMGFVKEELAEGGQRVKGAIVALEDDLRIRRALLVAPDIEFYRYQVNFRLLKS